MNKELSYNNGPVVDGFGSPLYEGDMVLVGRDIPVLGVVEGVKLRSDVTLRGGDTLPWIKLSRFFKSRNGRSLSVLAKNLVRINPYLEVDDNLEKDPTNIAHRTDMLGRELKRGHKLLEYHIHIVEHVHWRDEVPVNQRRVTRNIVVVEVSRFGPKGGVFVKNKSIPEHYLGHGLIINEKLGQALFKQKLKF